MVVGGGTRSASSSMSPAQGSPRSGDISEDPDVRGRTGIWSSGMRVLALEPEGLLLPTRTPEEDL